MYMNPNASRILLRTVCARGPRPAARKAGKPRAARVGPRTSEGDLTGVFFDADNVSHRACARILERAESLAGGRPAVRRAYVDAPNATQWSRTCARLGVEEVHVPRVRRKNSADIAMCVDIMEMSEALHTVVIVTNDSDFRHLCAALRRRGKTTVVATCGADRAPALLPPWADAHFHTRLDAGDLEDPRL